MVHVPELCLKKKDYGKLSINFIKKVKNLNRNWRVIGSFLSIPNFNNKKWPSKQWCSRGFTLWCKNEEFNRLIIWHINVNSISNRFDIFAEIIKDKVGVLFVSEKRLDNNLLDNNLHYANWWRFITLHMWRNSL